MEWRRWKRFWLILILADIRTGAETSLAAFHLTLQTFLARSIIESGRAAIVGKLIIAVEKSINPYSSDPYILKSRTYGQVVKREHLRVVVDELLVVIDLKHLRVLRYPVREEGFLQD